MGFKFKTSNRLQTKTTTGAAEPSLADEIAAAIADTSGSSGADALSKEQAIFDDPAPAADPGQETKTTTTTYDYGTVRDAEGNIIAQGAGGAQGGYGRVGSSSRKALTDQLVGAKEADIASGVTDYNAAIAEINEQLKLETAATPEREERNPLANAASQMQAVRPSRENRIRQEGMDARRQEVYDRVLESEKQKIIAQVRQKRPDLQISDDLMSQITQRATGTTEGYFTQAEQELSAPQTEAPVEPTVDPNRQAELELLGESFGDQLPDGVEEQPLPRHDPFTGQVDPEVVDPQSKAEPTKAQRRQQYVIERTVEGGRLAKDTKRYEGLARRNKSYNDRKGSVADYVMHTDNLFDLNKQNPNRYESTYKELLSHYKDDPTTRDAAVEYLTARDMLEADDLTPIS